MCLKTAVCYSLETTGTNYKILEHFKQKKVFNMLNYDHTLKEIKKATVTLRSKWLNPQAEISQNKCILQQLS